MKIHTINSTILPIMHVEIFNLKDYGSDNVASFLGVKQSIVEKLQSGNSLDTSEKSIVKAYLKSKTNNERLPVQKAIMKTLMESSNLEQEKYYKYQLIQPLNNGEEMILDEDIIDAYTYTEALEIARSKKLIYEGK